VVQILTAIDIVSHRRLPEFGGWQTRCCLWTI